MEIRGPNNFLFFFFSSDFPTLSPLHFSLYDSFCSGIKRKKLLVIKETHRKCGVSEFLIETLRLKLETCTLKMPLPKGGSKKRKKKKNFFEEKEKERKRSKTSYFFFFSFFFFSLVWSFVFFTKSPPVLEPPASKSCFISPILCINC